MTRRERLENKVERRLEWAASATAKANAAYRTARTLGDPIPLGQPNIGGRLTGVYSRIDSAMEKSVAESNKAEHHEQKAEELQKMLDNTIFSDDTDAVEKLEKKISALEHQQEFMKDCNKIIRSKKTDEEKAALIKEKYPSLSDESISKLLKSDEICPWNGAGFPSYALTNNNANIRRLKQRLESVKRRQERTTKAEKSENGITTEKRNGWYIITFAEFPGRDIINDLKRAGFSWRSGSWWGTESGTPESVKKLI